MQPSTENPCVAGSIPALATTLLNPNRRVFLFFEPIIVFSKFSFNLTNLLWTNNDDFQTFKLL